MEFRSDKISNSSNPFLSCLRGRERKNGRALTVQEILEIEVEFGDFVVNNYWYCQQDSTVANYYQEFDDWKRWATTYFGEEDSEEVVVGIFLRGLSEPIRNQMPSSLPTSLNRAYWEAISIELSLQLSLQISTILKDLFVKFPARSSEIKYDDSKDILMESTIQGSDNSDSNLLSDVKQKLDERCGFHGVSLIPIEGQEVEMVFDELPQRNFTVQQGKEASDEPDLCTFETDDSCKLIGKQVVVAAPMIMAEPCTLIIKVNCRPFIDAFPLTECMVDSVGTKVLIFYSMMVAYEPNDRMISLQDVSSDYENLIKELPFNSHAKRTVENEFHILQVTDNRASFILSPCCVYDPGGLWKFVCDASRSLDLLHDKFCSRAVGVHQIRTWFNEIWVLNTLDDCFDGVFGVGIRDGFVGDTHVTIQTPRTREHGKFQSGSTYYFDEIQYSIIKRDVNLGYNNVSLLDNYNLGGHVLVANEMECEVEEMDSHTFGTIDTSTGQYEDMKVVDDYLSVISLTLKLQDEAKDTGLLGVHAMCTIAAEPTPEFLKHYGCKIVLNSLAYGFTASEILNMEQPYMTSRIPIHLAYVERWDEQLRGIAPRRAGYLLTNTITSVLRYEATEKASQLTFVVQIQRTTMIKSQIRERFHKWKEKQLHLEGKVAFEADGNVTDGSTNAGAGTLQVHDIWNKMKRMSWGRVKEVEGPAKKSSTNLVKNQLREATSFRSHSS